MRVLQTNGRWGAPNRVKLMTLHASKGLEFDTVFIIGVNQGLIPLQCRSFEQEEEERRLFFVDITRAKVRGKRNRECEMIPPSPPEPVPVRHRKYGEGVLISEDEVTLTAEFPGCGQKQFLKALGELQFLSGADS